MDGIEQKSELIIRNVNGTATETDKQDLLNWINQDKENERIYFTMKDLYEAGNWNQLKYEAHTLRNWEELKLKINKPHETEKKPNRFLQVMKYAAIFVMGLLISGIVLRPNKTNNNSNFNNTIVTGVGERTQVVLPDGTKVWVNSCSSISYNYDYATNSRNVYLKGEAYFKVAKNKNLPFVVHSAGVEVKALGTSFNVSAYDNDNELSAVLLEGSISFETKQHGNAAVLEPGQKITYSKLSQKTKIEKVNAESYVAWSTGETRFEHLKMREITKRLERIYHVTFIVENEKIKNMHFTGTFRNYESLDQILKVINTNTNLNFKLVRDTVYMK